MLTAWQEFTLYQRYIADAETFNNNLPAGCHPADPSWFVAQRARVAFHLWASSHSREA